jgi:hypothetical protein
MNKRQARKRALGEVAAAARLLAAGAEIDPLLGPADRRRLSAAHQHIAATLEATRRGVTLQRPQRRPDHPDQLTIEDVPA